MKAIENSKQNLLSAGVPHIWAADPYLLPDPWCFWIRSNVQIAWIIPEPTLSIPPTSPSLWKNCLPQNWSLMPERLGTAELKVLNGKINKKTVDCWMHLRESFTVKQKVSKKYEKKNWANHFQKGIVEMGGFRRDNCSQFWRIKEKHDYVD